MRRSIRFPAELADKIRAEASRSQQSFEYVVLRTLSSALRDVREPELAPVTDDLDEFSAGEHA